MCAAILPILSIGAGIFGAVTQARAASAQTAAVNAQTAAAAAAAAQAPSASPTASAASPDVTASVQANRRLMAARAGFASTVANQGGSSGIGVSQGNLMTQQLTGSIGTKRTLGS